MIVNIDKKSQEEMITLLKDTLKEQEDMLQEQEDFLNSKEAELQTCQTGKLVCHNMEQGFFCLFGIWPIPMLLGISAEGIKYMTEILQWLIEKKE